MRRSGRQTRARMSQPGGWGVTPSDLAGKAQCKVLFSPLLEKLVPDVFW